MNEIFIHIIGVILGAFALKMLGLNKKIIINKNETRISWVWKLLQGLGKLAFYYGLFIFVLNSAFDRIDSPNSIIGISILSLGLVFWIVFSVVIFIKKN